MELQHILLSGPSGISELLLMLFIWMGPLLIVGLGIRKFIQFLKEKKENNE